MYFSMQKSSGYIYTHRKSQPLFIFFLKELLRVVNTKPKFKHILLLFHIFFKKRIYTIDRSITRPRYSFSCVKERKNFLAACRLL